MRALATMMLLVLCGCGSHGSDGSGGTGGNGGGGSGGSAGAGGSGGTSGGAGGGGGGFPGTACVPACDGKSCGDDGCGDVCGGCSADQLCTAAGACTAPPANSPLVVDPSGGRHPIHPAIYGLAAAGSASLDALHTPLNRWGGDGSTLYNWKNDVSNHAVWWFYENIPNDGGPGEPGDPGFVSSADRFVADNRDHGAATLMTIPTIGWAPKDRHGAPYSCGFPASRYGAGKVGQQQSSDSPDCGNALDGAGKIVAALVPSEAGV